MSSHQLKLLIFEPILRVLKMFFYKIQWLFTKVEYFYLLNMKEGNLLLKQIQHMRCYAHAHIKFCNIDNHY